MNTPIDSLMNTSSWDFWNYLIYKYIVMIQFFAHNAYPGGRAAAQQAPESAVMSIVLSCEIQHATVSVNNGRGACGQTSEGRI